MELLKTIKSKVWNQEKNNVVVWFFLENCANIHKNRNVNEKKYNALAHCIKQRLYETNNNLNIPFAFKRNLVTYGIRNSQEITTMNHKWEGCGSSRIVMSVICTECPPIPCLMVTLLI